ncbi:YbaB/EbfC family nucleoid-associated protein [Gluconobacter wancherniae]|uniref:Nucleoid-associated protein GWA01_00700 n=1 Tax=Gluconobacter wancherniae NBRC 103581 TaxID=656744 RepID=A0A511AVR9_9PROT|nr:YbaB/EbfC family nucleoid-associated protein [Gluconobacter wancherniae]MBF0852498.1 YbaB/EbfC family nucleoid-associated protein [Gluconobacter wancherniae]MBS1062163.1 YbaB/EbfC family nucleoid-associated protein [Gluconobacter wancherniae]MBS1087377.1 YbaB/EbfC family nucleoid-associated protein [Gluconobacter wancherniae]MBS1093066.1 YbaB/EbfC family nucleoid-associated protein [Gluconobacter wancherniae]GBD56792.1 nucleoid-associated protein [Gluconobacter wancherniae NBRC 103581]
MKNLAGLMKQASQMQAKMEEAQNSLAGLVVSGTAGAGLVTLTLTGKGEMKGLKIDPKLADPSEMEMLQDLIVAAYTDAKNKAEAASSEEMRKVTGGLDLPPGLKLPF